MWSMQEITYYSEVEVVPRTMDSNSVWMVQSQSNFDNDGARPVPYLQLVSPVVCQYIYRVLGNITSLLLYCTSVAGASDNTATHK